MTRRRRSTPTNATRPTIGVAPSARVLHSVLVEQGEEELGRPARSLFFAGLAAGLAIHLSLVAQAALHAMLPDAPWREAVTDFAIASAS